MKRLMSPILVAVALLSAPAAAHADGFLSPFIGVNFGGNTSDKSTVYGGALGFMGQKSGFEIDFGYTSEFFSDDTFDVDGKLVTVMGNVILGRQARRLLAVLRLRRRAHPHQHQRDR